MESELVNKLLALNRDFYSRFGAEFSDSRSGERLNLEPFRSYLDDHLQLLDVGCGNGRLAEALARAGYTLEYAGVDASSELIALANERGQRFPHLHAVFRRADLAEPGWSECVRDRAPFDRALALAVLHHLPGFELRARVLHEIRELLRPGGILVLSNWQLLNSERLRRKVVSWQKVGLDEQGLEAGDYLMDWQRGGVGYRYVHLVRPDEVGLLADASGMEVISQALADGDLNLYSILRRS